MTVLTPGPVGDTELHRLNRTRMRALLDELSNELGKAGEGGGHRYVERHKSRGKLLARERIDLLLDRDAPFLELSTLAAWGTGFPLGGSLVTGIGPSTSNAKQAPA
jgi:acetyl-CoA carboxylase carboxyltransferase component